MTTCLSVTWGNAQIIPNCDITVEAVNSQFVCDPGSTVNLNASITGDFWISRWLPGGLVTDSTQISTTSILDSTTTFTLEVLGVSETNLIVNGDFEMGSQNFTSDYQDNTGGGVGAINDEGTFGVDNSPRDLHRRFSRCGDNTTGNGNMMVVNGSGEANNVWCQTVTITPQNDYVFTAWASSVTNENPAQLQFSINGILVGEVFRASSNTCQWDQFFAVWNAEDNVTAEICVANVNLNPAGNDFAIDDIEFREVCTFTDQVTFTIPELSANWSTPVNICQTESAFALDNLLDSDATPGGSWTIDGVGTTELDPGSLVPGEYTVEYLVRQGDCSESNAQIVNINQAPNSGMPIDMLPTFCETIDTTIDLNGLISGQDMRGSWGWIGGPTDPGDLSGGMVDLNTLAGGNYIFQYLIASNFACEESTTDVQITINPNPIADAGEDTELDCLFNMASLGSGNTSAGNAFIYNWTSVEGNPILDPDQAITEIELPGTYRLSVTNTLTQCTATDEVVVASNVTEITANVSVLSSSCDQGTPSGIIEVNSIQGGAAPFSYSIDGTNFQSENTFNNLLAGNYSIVVQDGNNCQTTVEATVESVNAVNVVINLDANDPVTINLGDSIAMDLILNLPLSEIDSIVWSPTINNCTDNCSKVIARPPKTTRYEVMVKDIRGCMATAEQTILVNPAPRLFVPNVFSPNGDGINDEFSIAVASGVNSISQFQVLDRWGNLVFQALNINPTGVVMAWDGTFNGQSLDPGVYIYVAEIELTNGNTIIESGSVSLLD